MSASRTGLALFRFASASFAPAAAFAAIRYGSGEASTPLLARTLGPLAVVTGLALLYRCGMAVRARRVPGASLLERVDVLTGPGCATAWTAAACVVGAVTIGWASLAVVGSIGMTLVCATITWTCLRASGADAANARGLARSFAPGRIVAGAAVTEELRFVRPRIPLGMRMFVRSRVAPRWPVHRRVVEAELDGGQISLLAEVGPARRGVHQAEPVEVWLEDALGLCRSPIARVAAVEVVVLPAPREIHGVQALFANKVGSARELASAPRPSLRAASDAAARPAEVRATEGSQRLRTYAPGDDARRIHWRRSLATGEIVVRLPDEAPPEPPRVRVVIDTFFPGTDNLTCEAHSALLDAVVSVGVGVARALAARGVRVSVVAARGDGAGAFAAHELVLSRAREVELTRLGAEIVWQAALTPASLVGAAEGAVVVSCTPSWSPGVSWVFVPEVAWTCFDQVGPSALAARYRSPAGSTENRTSRRRLARDAHDRALADHNAFARRCVTRVPSDARGLVARPSSSAAARLEGFS